MNVMNETETQTTTGTIAGHSTCNTDPMPKTITFRCIEGGGEMLRIAEDGFYVRGEKIQQDAAEARRVYDAFASWLRTTGHNV